MTREPTKYDRKLWGFVLEHPEATATLDMLGARHGDNLQCHLTTQEDIERDPALSSLLDLEINDIMAYYGEYMYIVKIDGTLKSSPSAREKYGD